LKEKEPKDYSDFSNVRNIHEDLVPEEFPEGSFGSTVNAEQPVCGKTTSWKKGQRRQSAYIYPDKAIHDNLPRQAPGAHPLYDDPEHKEQ
jgi:hypothetical protein